MSAYRPVGRAHVARLERDLRELYERYLQLLKNEGVAPLIAADMSKYVCVRITGFIEQSTLSLARAHCSSRSAATVISFVESWLDRSQNPKRGPLIAFASRFDGTWGKELDEVFEILDPSGTFDSLVQTRNDISHGLATGIGKDSLDRYLDLAVEIVEWFVGHFDPLPEAATN